jgi:hypothetical protein
VPKSPVTADVHQTFDVHTNICAEISLDGKLPVDDFTDTVELFFGKVTDFFIEINARFRAYLPRRRTADAENVRERYFAPLIVWYVNSCNTRQSTASLPGTGQLVVMKKRYPCRCLCLGFFEQITRMTPRRLITLQPLHNFLTDALTFKIASPRDYLYRYTILPRVKS